MEKGDGFVLFPSKRTSFCPVYLAGVERGGWGGGGGMEGRRGTFSPASSQTSFQPLSKGLLLQLTSFPPSPPMTSQWTPATKANITLPKKPIGSFCLQPRHQSLPLEVNSSTLTILMLNLRLLWGEIRCKFLLEVKGLRS